jgi:hypothetical protein
MRHNRLLMCFVNMRCNDVDALACFDSVMLTTPGAKA